jgi:hypothetical protein
MLCIIALGAVTTIATLVTPAMAAPIRECGNYDGAHWTSNDDFGAGLYNLTTRGVSCHAARRVALYSPPDDRHKWRYRVFTCRYLTYRYEYVDVRCTASRDRAVRWQAGA